MREYGVQRGFEDVSGKILFKERGYDRGNGENFWRGENNASKLG